MLNYRTGVRICIAYLSAISLTSDLHLPEKRRLSGEYPILNEAGLDLDP